MSEPLLHLHNLANPANLRALFEASSDFMFVINRDGAMLWVNRVVTERLGYTEQELIGQSLMMIHPPELRGEAGRIAKAMLERVLTVCELPLITSDGTYIPVETRVVDGVWNEEKVLFGISRDISKVAISEEKFAKAFEFSTALMAISTLEDGRFVEVNQAFLMTLGYSREEVIGRTSQDLGIFTDPSARTSLLRRVDEAGTVSNFEAEFRTRSGDVRAGYFSAQKIQLQGTPQLLSVVNDMTEQRRAVTQLAQREKLLSVIARAGERLLFASDFTPAVNDVLSSLGHAVDVGRVYIFENHTEVESGRLLMSQRYEWTNGAVSVEIDNPTLQNLPYDDGLSRWKNELSAGREVSGPVATFPATERELLEPQGILSLLVVPIFLQQQFWGFIGFDDCKTSRIWFQSEIDLLRLAASILGGSIQRSRTEASIRQSKELLDVAVVGAELGVWDWNVRTGKLGFNDRWAQMLGFEVSELPATVEMWKSIVHPADLSAALVAIQAHIEDPSIPYELEIRMQAKNGTWRRILTRGRVVDRSPDGQPLRFSGTHLDITERVRMETALQQSQQRYQSVLDTILEVIFHIDTSGKWVMVNRAWEAITGFPVADTLGKSIFDFVHPDDVDSCRSKLLSLLEEPEHVDYQEEFRCLTRGGGFRWIFVQARASQGDAHRATGIAGSMRDVTVSRQAGEQMQAALLREQELNRLRNEFITMASHEFRTPLAGIMHSAEILKDYGHDLLPAKRDRYHTLILGGAKRIDNLIEEVLILGKTQAGRLTCRPQSLDLRAFVDRCLSELPISADNIARVRVSLNLTKDTHPLDAALLRHSLINLLTNGLKYSAADKPVDLRISDQGGQLLIIEVEDCGIGVPPKDLPDLFNPFHRGSNIGNVKGSGVGLSIVKSCVEVHRGTIDVVSELDKGSKFTVRIPISPPEHSISSQKTDLV